MFSNLNITDYTRKILGKSLDEAISVDDARYLMGVNGADFFALLGTADCVREELVGDRVTFINNCNINFTNICTVRCGFCAFGKDEDDPDAYHLNHDEILSVASKAVGLGAREFCVMGGVHSGADIFYYEDILNLLKGEFPDVDIHGFSPTMIYDAAKVSELSVGESLKILKRAGLDTLPGTAAEILSARARKIICPNKISVEDWIDVVETAHKIGIPGSATMMYGHVETLEERIEHLNILKKIQERTGGFTEFIPMTFMHEYSPIFLEGQKNLGATGTEDLKLYAIARLMFRELIPNIQVSWVKMGFRFAQIALTAGANDFGGTLGEDELSEASGAPDGIGTDVENLSRIIKNLGRTPYERNSKYSEFYPIK